MSKGSTLLLGIDTCGLQGSVALARLSGDALESLAETELAGKTYSARLAGAIRELLAGREAGLRELAAIVVTSGPGSFTGIRIGLSTAKGLAEAHRTPILAVSRLAVLAHVAGTRAAALDASRGEFYLGEFAGEQREWLVAGARFQEEAARLGDELAVCEASVLALALNARSVAPPTAARALEFALPRLRTGRFDDAMTLDGDYLRRSDAEIFAKPRTGMTLRAMLAEDLSEVVAIAQACPEVPRWRPEDYTPYMQQEAAGDRTSGRLCAGWVAVAGARSEILGFAAASLVLDGEENRCELESMAVRVDARRQGTGAALLRAVMAWAVERGARRLGLEVRAGNAAAIRLYERLGLRPEGRRHGYYTDPEEDALLLGAAVPAAAFSTAQGS
ncbi:MAG TPA: tRNA (adenosine(37)-N6)-threonylcarbamoyltransferase complex dimerization subunit type 1 TsaB [Acidobacteriaceae bacterium]|nr:tRNA (adenosine(37)-N6)-threonylcarbamoyltransferase complex dimerization subunit type 1 TsaB [Acidobacteriaceae bacterium]